MNIQTIILINWFLFIGMILLFVIMFFFLKKPTVEDRLKFAELIIRFLLPAVLVFIGALLVQAMQQEHQESQFQSQLDMWESQHKLDEGRLAELLIPRIIGGQRAEREIALKILQNAAPGVAKFVAEALAATAQTESERQYAQRVADESQRDVWRAKFRRHMELARQYQDYGQHAAAYREYNEALKILPQTEQGKVDRRLIQQSRESYDRGNYLAAARMLDGVLKGLVVD